jgi:hypothetical protein
MAIYATVLFVLGMIDRLADFASPANDPVGQALANEGLPPRVYQRRRLVAESA